MSSIVTMPSVPPYSSTTTARWVRFARISVSAASTGLLPGSSGAGRAMSPTVRTSGPPVTGDGREQVGEQVADVHDPDDLVHGLADDRVARVRLVEHVAGGRRRVSVSAGRNSTSVRGTITPAELAVGGPEHVGEHPALLGVQLAVGADHVAQLLLGDLLAPCSRVEAEHPHEQVGRRRQQPDDGAAISATTVEHRRRRRARSLRALQGEPLGHELAQHQRQVGDERRHGDERDRCPRCRAAGPTPSSTSPSGSDRVAPPYAEAKNPASVTPTCTEARNRLESAAAAGRARPRGRAAGRPGCRAARPPPARTRRRSRRSARTPG